MTQAKNTIYLWYDGDTEQFNGREGETATLLLRRPLNFMLCVLGLRRF